MSTIRIRGALCDLDAPKGSKHLGPPQPERSRHAGQLWPNCRPLLASLTQSLEEYMPNLSQGTPNPGSGARRKPATNAGLIEIQIQYRAVGDLVLDPRNPRQHSQSQVNQIADSIREFGFVMPIVVDDTSQVVIGHGRILAARKLGMPRVPVVEIRHLSPAQLKALRIADNRLAQHAHWDERLLGENFLELKELDLDFDLSITGFSIPEIDLAIQKLDGGVTVDATDEADAMTGVPVCRLGDVWQLGDHRVHCGDATSEAAFDNRESSP